MTDRKLQQLYDNYLEFTDHMVSKHGPMEVAAVMMAQALTIYKTSMSEDDYHRIVDDISASRDKVKTFESPLIQ
jgi:hypothetical protein